MSDSPPPAADRSRSSTPPLAVASPPTSPTARKTRAQTDRERAAASSALSAASPPPHTPLRSLPAAPAPAGPSAGPSAGAPATYPPLPKMTATSSAIAAMPVLRAVALRTGRSVNPNRPVNGEAIYAYMAGTIQTPACGHCVKNSGPFPLCVAVAGLLNGSCSNCHYNSEGSRCSFSGKSTFPSIFCFAVDGYLHL